MLSDSVNWLALAKDADTFHVDIGWIIVSDFYYGPSHPKTSEEFKEFESKQIKLSPPPITKGSYILSADAIKAPGHLIDHYYRILSLCREFEKPLESQCFWMRPVICSGNKDGHGIDFRWLDSYGETIHWVESICRNDDDELFYDIDQCWEVEFRGEGQFIFGAQSGGPEDPDDIQAYRFTRSLLQEKARAAADRATVMVEKINTQLGMKIFTN